MKDKNKTKSNDPVNPLNSDILISERSGNFDSVGSMNPFGLTKREYFAGLAMQGLVAHSYRRREEQVELAVKLADELIYKLNDQR